MEMKHLDEVNMRCQVVEEPGYYMVESWEYVVEVEPAHNTREAWDVDKCRASGDTGRAWDRV